MSDDEEYHEYEEDWGNDNDNEDDCGHFCDDVCDGGKSDEDEVDVAAAASEKLPVINRPEDVVNITRTWFNNQETSDVMVHLKNGEVIYCHRLMLIAWSDVWRAALESKTDTSLELKMHDESTVRLCLEYCYSGSIQIPVEGLGLVHHFSSCYNIKGLQELCKREMLRHLRVANCLSLYSYLVDYKLPDLSEELEEVKDMVSQNFAKATQAPSFLRMSSSTLCQLLREDLTASEDEVLDACCRWFEATKPEESVREAVMKLVRLPQLSPKALLDLKVHPLMAQCPSLLQRYHRALEWLAAEQAGANRTELRKRIEKEHQGEVFAPRKRTKTH